MTIELLALDQNQTWSLVELPPSKTIFDCQWVYKIKHRANGTIERYKAGLVAKGYTQLEGVNFFNAFSLVAKLTTFLVLLALAATNGIFNI